MEQLTRYCKFYHSVSGKKETKMFFVMSSIQFERLIKFGTQFLE